MKRIHRVGQRVTGDGDRTPCRSGMVSEPDPVEPRPLRRPGELQHRRAGTDTRSGRLPNPEIADPDVTLLAEIATDLEGRYADDFSMWEGSPFGWIKTRPSQQVGAIAEKLVSHWCAAKDLSVSRSPDHQADLVIDGTRVEVKYSSLWTDGGIYKFQQIRDQNYDSTA